MASWPPGNQMVAGRQVFRRSYLPGRHYLLDKLMAFHPLHDTPFKDGEALVPDFGGASRRVCPASKLAG